ncbi:MAG TPA: ATP synthase subunit I [Piscirickettsiaceae bacterium]|nr:ATP synthase subunit I [Piscirickettsiaceae bacterium]HIQ40377.1 ATP synthase subunit I [Sulfurivirga caldicuralii]
MNGQEKAVWLQGGLGLLAVVGFGMIQGEWLSALFGFGIGVANLAMLSVGFRLANERAKEDPKAGMTVLYISAVIRFILLAVFFALGMALVGLAPMPMVLTFVVMQLGNLFSLQGKRRLTD